VGRSLAGEVVYVALMHADAVTACCGGDAHSDDIAGEIAGRRRELAFAIIHIVA